MLPLVSRSKAIFISLDLEISSDCNCGGFGREYPFEVQENKNKEMNSKFICWWYVLMVFIINCVRLFNGKKDFYLVFQFVGGSSFYCVFLSLIRVDNRIARTRR